MLLSLGAELPEVPRPRARDLKGRSSPDSSMGSLSTDLRTWSDSPVRELSSILRSLPWMKRPSAGRRSPGGRKERQKSVVSGTER